MDIGEALQRTQEFGRQYHYDVGYIEALLDHSPTAFMKLQNCLPLLSHREKLSPEEFWVAKLATTQVEDCGECLQLNVRMAVEAAVPKEMVEAVLRGGEALPGNLRDVYRYVTSIAANDSVSDDVMSRIEARYDRGARLELGLCIASAKLFPTLKRAIGHAKSCSLIALEI